MSVNWDWNRKMGEITLKQKHGDGKSHTFKLTMYSANCLCALTWDYKEKDKESGKVVDKYMFYGFWSDSNHLKRCLGISKVNGKHEENLYGKDSSDQFTKVKLNTLYFDRQEVITMAKAFAQVGIKVELYHKELKEKKSHSTKKGN